MFDCVHACAHARKSNAHIFFMKVCFWPSMYTCSINTGIFWEKINCPMLYIIF